MNSMIFNIQSFCIHDGPGVRTTVFLKGCPLNCFWCHNPEGIEFGNNLMIFEKKCIDCARCDNVCPSRALKRDGGHFELKKNECIYCGLCVDACPSDVFEIVGKKMSAAAVVDIVEKDKPFFGQNGGVTFSGGEPMAHIDFLDELLTEAKNRGIHTAIDTSGYADWCSFMRILKKADIFLYDIKGIDNTLHKRNTGVDNTVIWDNLELLSREGKRIWVRMPIVPGANDDEKMLMKTAEKLSKLNIEQVELMPYHKIGAGKYDLLKKNNQANGIEIPTCERMESLKSKMRSKNINVI